MSTVEQLPRGIERRVNPSGEVRYMARMNFRNRRHRGPARCTIEEALADFELMCEERESALRRRVRGERVLPQVVYFIQQGTSGPIKIGVSARDQVQKRLGELQIGNPELLRVVGVVDGGRVVELAIHEHLRRYRLRGEWFVGVRAVTDVLDKLPRAVRAAQHSVDQS